MAHQRRMERGFTLGELMATVAVVGIGLALAVPSFQNITRNNRRATAMNQLVAAMHMARSEAVTRNMQVTVCPSVDGDNCDGDWEDGWIFFPDSDQDHARDDDETILGTGGPMGALTVTTDEFPAFITYRPNGRAMADEADENSGRFTFCDARGPEFAGVVLISPIGQPVLPHDTDGLDIACPEA